MTTTTPPDARNALAEIVAGLDGVTPGPWRASDYGGVRSEFHEGIHEVARVDLMWGRNRNGKNTAHIARLDPATVRSIADYVAALEAQVEGMRVALKPFARIADMEEHQPPAASVMVNVSRCRDARAALQSSETTGEKP